VLNSLAVKVSEGAITHICFDYFDTLVTRTVYPEYTKEMAAKLLSLSCGELIGAGELYSIRRELEQELCEQRAEAGGELEFYLPEFAHIILVESASRAS